MLTPTIWDAIVVGAGPAGSVLALALARQSLSVLLVDQAVFPRGKVCGGCLNANALSALQQLRLPQLPAQLGGQPVHALHLNSRGKTVTIALPEGVGISRAVLDEALIEECVNAGVEFLPHTKATMGELQDQTRTVLLRTGTTETRAKARVVVLAHGLKSGTVARHSRMGAGVVLSETPPGYAPHTIHMAVGQGGYVGGITVEDGRYDIAAALDTDFVQRCGSLGLAAKTILQEAGFPNIANLEVAGWKGTPLLTRQTKPIAGERWFAVGDAAGYVEPFTGEGMAWAMTGALALAPLVTNAVQEWRTQYIRQWAQTHARTVGRRQWQCRTVARVLRSGVLSTVLVKALSWCPVLAKPFVLHLSRPTAPSPGAFR